MNKWGKGPKKPYWLGNFTNQVLGWLVTLNVLDNSQTPNRSLLLRFILFLRERYVEPPSIPLCDSANTVLCFHFFKFCLHMDYI